METIYSWDYVNLCHIYLNDLYVGCVEMNKVVAKGNFITMYQDGKRVFGTVSKINQNYSFEETDVGCMLFL
jgi:hypothetical protein